MAWESLRKDIAKYGLRHSTLSAQMPSESSSVVSNETNGIEPPRALLSIKKSKKGPLKQIAPGFPKLRNDYTLLWEMPNNEGYINGYNKNHQSVIIPAFIAAYSGQSAEKITLDPVNKKPLPNWNINYTGLMKIKSFKKIFNRFSLIHGYRSSMTK